MKYDFNSIKEGTKKAAIMGVLAGGLTALVNPNEVFADSYETREFCNDVFFLAPSFLEPGFCKDARETVREIEREKRSIQGRGGINITTPQGYIVRLSEGSQTRYNGEIYYIKEINEPYISLAPRKIKNDGTIIYDTNHPITIHMKELSIFKE